MPPLLKNKTVQFVIGISLGILILVIILSPKRSVNQTPISPQTSGSPTRPELIDLNAQKRSDAATYVLAISGKLPLYQEGFKTSVGIDTTINIYRQDTDPEEVVRLEIYGLSYINKDANPVKNPNVTAYKESYAEAISMLEGVNIDPKKLIFIYGDKEYVRTTTQTWIDALKLQP